MSQHNLPSSSCPSAPSAASALPAGTVFTAACGLAGAWVAAGDAGLMAHSLRHALVLGAMAAALAASWPERWGWRGGATLAGAAMAAALMNAASLAPINVLAVAVFMAGLALVRTGPGGRTVLIVSQAVAVFGLYRLAVTSIPALWMAADRLGGGLGRLLAAMTGHPAEIGASFGGIDVLILTAVFGGLWLTATPRPRLVRGLMAAAGVLAAHALYLVAISYAPRLIGLFAEPAPDAPWSVASAVRTLLPWNLPAVAILAQVGVACVVLRWSPPPAAADVVDACRSRFWRGAILPAAGAALASAVLAISTCLYPAPPSLEGKKIVLYEQGFGVGGWTRPAHGDYGHLSVGMYGLLPDFLESLGAKAVKSPDLSEHDLEGADAVILIYPDKPWAPGQLDRLWAFVRGGGSLLVFGEHTVREADGGARFNDVLEPTGMRVRFDMAEWAVGGWLECYEPLAHPITEGWRSDRNDFGIVIGASVTAAWPARPLILGRWGWADEGDPGSRRAMIGNDKYDEGERLGDVCLAAEQRLGRGKVVVFGDPSSVTNGVNITAHDFVAALVAYVASPDGGPADWRYGLAAVAALAAMGMLVWRPQAWPVLAVGLAASLALACGTAATHRASHPSPDGRRQAPNNLAYIDMAHLGAFSEEGLREDGLLGLELTLARSGLLPLGLNEFRPETLGKAGLLISVAPAREFSPAERRAVRAFVEGGGVFICTVGYDSSAAAAPLLADFGFRIAEPGHPDKIPSPLGHFKSPYLMIDGKPRYVRFHAAWPVSDEASAGRGPAGSPLPAAQAVANGSGDVPVILMRAIGKGQVVVVGDTGFAWNANLEHMDGSPFEGVRENADFWRWFLALLTGRPAWTPPEPVPVPEPAAAGAVPAPPPAPAAPAASATSSAAAPPTAPAASAAPPPAAGPTPSVGEVRP